MALSDYQTESWAKGYRDFDNHVTSRESWQDYANLINTACNSFDKEINVLDIACGTGRFFCALENVNTLYGLDNSQAMLDQAKKPINTDQVKEKVKNINLICHSFREISTIFQNQKFDFIFSIGMLNEYGPSTDIDVKFFNDLDLILKKDGILLFSIDDSREKVYNILNLSSMKNAQEIQFNTLRDDKNHKLILRIKK